MRRVLLAVAIFAFSPIMALAHESRPAYLELQQKSEDVYDVLWKVPARGQDMRLGLYVRLPDDCKTVDPVRSSFMGGAFVERSTISRSGGLAGAEIYIEGLTNTLTDVLVRVGRLDGSTQVARLTPSAPSFVVDTAPTTIGVAKTYTFLGVQHIWNGIDHLLFVACLMMVAGTGRKLLITITGFTVAHSITLALSTLELVQLPGPPVEATIALSIVFVASEIAKGSRETLTYRYPIAVSSSFGLLHGFGFAAVLSGIGIPRTEIPASLLFFNVGVEIGQLLFIGAVLILIGVLRALARQKVHYIEKLERPMAYVCGSAGMYWVIARLEFLW